MNFDFIPFNFSMLLKEIEARQIQLHFIEDTDIIEARLADHKEYLINYITRLTPGVYLSILRDKFYSKSFVKSKGISVPEGQVFSLKEAQQALEFAQKIGFPVVIKPVNGSQGDFVFANLLDETEFLAAFQRFIDYSESRCILVEKHFAGDDYRFLVIADKDIAVVKRAAPQIVGDGESTIKTLVEQENHRRMNPRNTCLCPIYLDYEADNTLIKQGLTQDSVLALNQVALVRSNANVSTGGSCDNVLEQVHPSYLELARHIHSLFPGNAFTCIDLLAKNVSEPVSAMSYAFCEFNPDPGFSLHEMPGTGKPHYVVRSIVDLLFPETAKD